jgi:N-methylhydantoinase A
VEEFGSTTVVFPGQHLEVDPHGILIIRAGIPKQAKAMP